MATMTPLHESESSTESEHLWDKGALSIVDNDVAIDESTKLLESFHICQLWGPPWPIRTDVKILFMRLRTSCPGCKLLRTILDIHLKNPRLRIHEEVYINIEGKIMVIELRHGRSRERYLALHVHAIERMPELLILWGYGFTSFTLLAENRFPWPNILTCSKKFGVEDANLASHRIKR
jgi:hypothetical protein